MHDHWSTSGRTSSRRRRSSSRGEPVQQRGEQCPVGGGEPDLLAVQVPFEDRDLVPEREDFGILSRSPIGSSRSSARALLTPRYASRNSK